MSLLSKQTVFPLVIGLAGGAALHYLVQSRKARAAGAAAPETDATPSKQKMYGPKTPTKEDGLDSDKQDTPSGAHSDTPSSDPWNLVYRDYKMGDVYLAENIRITETKVMSIPRMADYLDSSLDQKYLNFKWAQSQGKSQKVLHRNYLNDDCVILCDIVRKPSSESSRAFIRGGPRKHLWFDPLQTKVAVVTTGGLCPGLNNIIRQITLSLLFGYGTKQVIGIRNGFWGFHTNTTMELNRDTVRSIQLQGGSILGSNRGGEDPEVILNWLLKNDVQMLFVIGGDGSHRAAYRIYEQVVKQGLNICVGCVPKTIDNDVDLVDRSFGFYTAVDEAVRAIHSAYIEARCVHNGIGIVKLMGRSAGCIAGHATMASGLVDLCLIPEVPTVFEGESGCCPWLESVLKRKGYAVVVVGEGVADQLMKQTGATDKGGNKIIPDVGPLVKSYLKAYFDKNGIEVNIKYIDPSYMIRSVPANADDSVLCMTLSQTAVHAAMAGYNGFTVGLTNNRSVLLPIRAVMENSPRPMNPFGRTWERILITTGQPDTTSFLETKYMEKVKDGVQFTA